MCVSCVESDPGSAMRRAEEQLGAAAEVSAALLLIRFHPVSVEKLRHFVHVSPFFQLDAAR